VEEKEGKCKRKMKKRKIKKGERKREKGKLQG
jgi:hypothetical protein